MSNNTNKIIQVKPELFNTKKKTARRTRNTPAEETDKPAVTASQLKTNLLKRFREHKRNELNDATSHEEEPPQSNNGDEFSNSINYLADLSTKYKQNSEKIKYEHQKTLRHKHTTPVLSDSAAVELELPSELQVPISANLPTVNLNYKVDNAVPYGCLKGGKKQTYKNWRATTATPPENNFVSTITSWFGGGGDNKPATTLQAIKNARSQCLRTDFGHDINERSDVYKNSRGVTNAANKPTESATIPQTDLHKDFASAMMAPPQNGVLVPPQNETPQTGILKTSTEPPQGFLKKRITKHKYTLGKNAKKRIVSILVKDKKTRKHVVDAQKELRKTNLQDIKKYLREKGIMRYTSSAPTDVLRQTYENAMLTGEVTNINREAIIQNFLNSSTTSS